MSYQKVLEVAKKFADAQKEKSRNQQFQEQRERVTIFFEAFYKEFAGAVNLMESDINTLKLKGFDSDMLKIMTSLYHSLVEYRKTITDIKSKLGVVAIYDRINKIYEYVFSRKTLPIIDNLEFLIQHFLKNNQVDFLPSTHLTQSKVESFKKLKNVLVNAKNFMNKYPLLDMASESIPPAIPALVNESVTPHIPAEALDKTNVAVPMPQKKLPPAAE